MNVFVKTKKTHYYGNHNALPFSSIELQRKFGINLSYTYALGIDGSTTAFGVAWFTENPEDDSMMILIRDLNENGKKFMDNVFPFLQNLFRGLTFKVVTYERTPDDFSTNTQMVRTMKKTEEAVRNFLTNPYYVAIEHRDHVFDIFPVSWRRYMVNTDLLNNPGKINKRENALAVLEKRGHNPQVWLTELDAMTNHSYDCVEALGIGLYGFEFIYSEPFIRPYRNFVRRRPLTLLGSLVPDDILVEEIGMLHSVMQGAPIRMFIPNVCHSAFENLYSLDDDKSIGLLITEKDSELRIYLEHIHGLYDKKDNVLLSFVLRDNQVCNDIVKQLEALGTYVIIKI